MEISNFIKQVRALLGLTDTHSIKSITECILNYDKHEKDTLYRYIRESLQVVVVPNKVTEIPDYFFYDQKKLTSITIPNSVTSIGNSAFYRCDALTSITIPNSVTSIETHAFYGCNIHFIFECAEGEEPSGMPWGAYSYTVEYNYKG